MANRSILRLTLLTIVFSAAHLLAAQHEQPKAQAEQSDFGIEDVAGIQRPVILPRAALDVLSKDDSVASCLENEVMNAKQLPANWFAASEIHLDGPSETDLIVLPGSRLPDTPPDAISPNACFLGANTGQMWVLRKTQQEFKLVLSQIGLGMSVLSNRTNGLRDIQIGAVVGGYDDSIDYEFDGQTYKIAARTSNLIGAEPPSTPSAFENRESLIQSPGQTAESVRAQARAWLWQKWEQHEHHKRSWLTLETHDEGVDETSCFFITPDEKGEWQVTIQVNRIVHDADATASQNRITEKELLVATEVQRVEPKTDELHVPRAILGDRKLPESEYRLRFLDYGARTVATL